MSSGVAAKGIADRDLDGPGYGPVQRSAAKDAEEEQYEQEGFEAYDEANSAADEKLHGNGDSSAASADSKKGFAVSYERERPAKHGFIQNQPSNLIFMFRFESFIYLLNVEFCLSE